jgi:hypothetical protein
VVFDRWLLAASKGVVGAEWRQAPVAGKSVLGGKMDQVGRGGGAHMRALSGDSASAKAHFRRGAAREQLGMLDEARVDLEEAARLGSGGKQVLQLLRHVKQKLGIPEDQGEQMVVAGGEVEREPQAEGGTAKQQPTSDTTDCGQNACADETPKAMAASAGAKPGAAPPKPAGGLRGLRDRRGRLTASALVAAGLAHSTGSSAPPARDPAPPAEPTSTQRDAAASVPAPAPAPAQGPVASLVAEAETAPEPWISPNRRKATPDEVPPSSPPFTSATVREVQTQQELQAAAATPPARMGDDSGIGGSVVGPMAHAQQLLKSVGGDFARAVECLLAANKFQS